MAAPLSAARQLAALKAEGCTVVEHRSWRTHNRNHKGAWGPVYGVMIHHTVTSGTDSSVRLCYDGHTALPGPLCHTVGAKDGTLHMVGNGRANHAGLGDGAVLQAVIAERALPPDTRADTDGNRHFYGIELVNLGDGRDPWPEAQVDAAARWAAAICRAHGWNERSVIGHLEWQPGKVDPRGFTMTSFRARVGALLARPAGAAPPGPGTPAPAPAPKEDDVTPADIYKGAWEQDRMKVPAAWSAHNPTNDTWQPKSVLINIGERVRAVEAQLAAQAATIDKLADAVGAAGAFDPDGLKREIREAIESITVRLDTIPEGDPS